MLYQAHITRLLLGGLTLGMLSLAPASAQFQSDNVELETHLPLSFFNSAFAEDCWGYVSPSGREYAIIGLSQGTGFVEITDPANPVLVDIELQTSQGRDMKVYQNYVYSSADQGPTVIFDVSDIDNGNIANVGSFNTGTHNLAIDEVSGFLYLAVGGPLNIYDLANPANPVFVGAWSGETHDVQVMTYTSGTYAGRQIAFVFAGYSRQVNIIDVTNKSNVFLVGSTGYSGSAYTHQGWLSTDLQYLFVNDELDNIPRTSVFDVSDLSNPIHLSDFSNGTPSTDHNLYVRGDYVYEANYTSGLRIWDISDPLNSVEVGFFDTYPSNDSPGFSGAWSAYPFFPSGSVIVSDRESGLFILDPSEATKPATATLRNAGANPVSYTATPPVIGSTFAGTVDLAGTTGHSMAGLVGYLTSLNLPLAGGQVLLVNVADAGGELLGLPFMAGPIATFNAGIPNDTSLCGLRLSTQAFHAGGVFPFALANAQDLVVGF
ncbi:MAG: choice-of-anchor B domain-containing protein [Planctomycetota bacterium]|jgi:choice-of-anchor B domain-containing protein